MKEKHMQLNLPFSGSHFKESTVDADSGPIINQSNKIDQQDRSFHNWYRFVLSFPPHLVRYYIEDFELNEKDTVLDPFCGTGTTLVECKLNRIRTIGVEANPFPQFASSVKIDWSIDPKELVEKSSDIANTSIGALKKQGINDNWGIDGSLADIHLKKLGPDADRLLLSKSISPLPLHKTLVLLGFLKKHENEHFYRYALLALAKALVCTISNLKFSPEVGVGKLKSDSPVVSSWLSELRTISEDLNTVKGIQYPKCTVYLGDSREISGLIEPNSIDAVITSPPYPNEKDYTRITRLESVILGFISNKGELQSFKKRMIRSNTRGVYKDDDDDLWIAQHKEILEIADEIEKRRRHLGKTSGFEKLYPRVTRLYFGGMMKHLAELRPILRPGARLAFVVGDQASYLRIMIRTGKLLAQIAQSLGYEVIRIDLFRTRFATATGEQLREEVVVLRWPGKRMI